MPTLFLMCGLPGSGKTTLAKQLERERSALRLTPDEWLPGHQDRIMPVDDDSRRKARIRDGFAYAEPDAHTLAQLVALRLHFDPTDADTGALCVVAGSHLSGVLSTAQIRDVPLESYAPCPAAPGDVLAMRPLLLHRSSPSRGEGVSR